MKYEQLEFDFHYADEQYDHYLASLAAKMLGVDDDSGS